MNAGNKIGKVVVSLVDKMLYKNANSTNCVYIYQPIPPKQLSRFKKSKSDK